MYLRGFKLDPTINDQILLRAYFYEWNRIVDHAIKTISSTKIAEN